MSGVADMSISCLSLVLYGIRMELRYININNNTQVLTLFLRFTILAGYNQYRIVLYQKQRYLLYIVDKMLTSLICEYK